MVWEFAVAMRALGFHERVAERRIVGRRVGESESHHHTAFRQISRHRTSVRAGAGARFEAWDVDSCSAPAEMRRRSQEELGGGETLDKLHGSAAERTVPS